VHDSTEEVDGCDGGISSRGWAARRHGRLRRGPQQPALPVVGYLSDQSADDYSKYAIIPFLQGLKETDYVEGQNVAVDYRYAENQPDRLPALAADLVRRRVSVIATSGTPAALAARAATATIPIVFYTSGDPVALGLVANADGHYQAIELQ
jgi:putative ABC transport system substrate-binding protein